MKIENGWKRRRLPWRRLKMVVLLQHERRGAVVLMVAAVTGASLSWWLPAMVGHGGG